MSFSQIDHELEEKLNDIDEFIQSQLGLEDLDAGGPLPETETKELNCFLGTRKFLYGSPLLNNPENVDAKMVTCPELPNKVPEIMIEVQIMDLKDVYNKKVKKTLEGLEYPLEDSKVTVVVQASEEITSVRAYTQRCPEAAIRTHDTIGPVELNVNTLQSDARSQVVTVDLGSVYKTKNGHPVYWLEKADVVQRNKWQLVISVELSSGLTGSVTSRPFRVTTKASCKIKRKGESVPSSHEVQQLFLKITGSNIQLVTGRDDCRSQNVLSNSGVKKEFAKEEYASCHVKEVGFVVENDSATHSFPAEYSGDNYNSKSSSSSEERVLFQPNTVLDRQAVTTYYGGEQRIHRAVEQPEVPGLLKLVAKQSEPVSSRRKANGHKSAEEVVWWACGVCFFERSKKSTIKDHVVRRVCQKSIENKKTKRRFVKRRLQRHFSCDFEMERFESYSWKDCLSV